MSIKVIKQGDVPPSAWPPADFKEKEEQRLHELVQKRAALEQQILEAQHDATVRLRLRAEIDALDKELGARESLRAFTES